MADNCTSTQDYDAQHGTYKPPVPRTGNNAGDLLPAAAMPKAPDPTPFKLGGGGGGK